MKEEDLEKIIEKLRHTPLPDEYHLSHLCVIWNMYRDIEKMKPFVLEAKYICKLCGRTSERHGEGKQGEAISIFYKEVILTKLDFTCMRDMYM